MRYRKYNPMVMKMIIDTGNIKLFPELHIPRTTAKYWIEKSKSPIVVNISNETLTGACKYQAPD